MTHRIKLSQSAQSVSTPQTSLNIANWNLHDFGSRTNASDTLQTIIQRENSKMKYIDALVKGGYGSHYDVIVFEEATPSSHAFDTLRSNQPPDRSFAILKAPFARFYDCVTNNNAGAHSVVIFVKKKYFGTPWNRFAPTIQHTIKSQDIRLKCPTVIEPWKLVGVVLCLSDGRQVLIFGTHLSLNSAPRQQAVVACINLYKTTFFPLIQMIVVGDMNTDKKLPFMTHQNVQVGFGTLAKIDQLYSSRSTTLELLRSHFPERWSVSDHTLLSAKVAFAPFQGTPELSCTAQLVRIVPHNALPLTAQVNPNRNRLATHQGTMVRNTHTNNHNNNNGGMVAQQGAMIQQPPIGTVVTPQETHPQPHTIGTDTEALNQKALEGIYGDYYEAQVGYSNGIEPFQDSQLQSLSESYNYDNVQGLQLVFVFCILVFVLCGLVAGCVCVLLWFLGYDKYRAAKKFEQSGITCVVTDVP
eukprot:197538_1